jgi:hypothetical protein
VRDEREVGQRRAGRDHLGAADVDAGVALLDHLDVDVRAVRRRQIAIDRRMHDRVVDVPGALLGLAVPAGRVRLEALVEHGVRAERAQERPLVVGRPAHPAPGASLPVGDRVALGDLLLDRVRGAEEAVREASPFGRDGENVLALRVVQRVVHARDHPCRVAERRMVGDLLDALAVDPDLAVILEAREVLVAGERDERGAGRDRRSLVAHGVSPVVGVVLWESAPNMRCCCRARVSPRRCLPPPGR